MACSDSVKRLLRTLATIVSLGGVAPDSLISEIEQLLLPYPTTFRAAQVAKSSFESLNEVRYYASVICGGSLDSFFDSLERESEPAYPVPTAELIFRGGAKRLAEGEGLRFVTEARGCLRVLREGAPVEYVVKAAVITLLQTKFSVVVHQSFPNDGSVPGETGRFIELVSYVPSPAASFVDYTTVIPPGGERVVCSSQGNLLPGITKGVRGVALWCYQVFANSPNSEGVDGALVEYHPTVVP